MEYYTYIVTNPGKTTLYTGVTNNLVKRIVEHYLQRGINKTFAGKYYCYCLVWYDSFPTMQQAIDAEKRIKGKKRSWKNALIEDNNQDWHCLNKTLLGEWPPNHTLSARQSS